MIELIKADYIILVVSILLFALILIKLNQGEEITRTRAKINLPFCRLIYADQKSGVKSREAFGKVLYSPEHGLRGKPDYIFKSAISGKFIPVEIKSGLIGGRRLPHEGDIMQLYAYFLITEDVYGKRPPYGMLIYKDCGFKVRNTRLARKKIKETITRMRRMLETGDENAQPEFSRCRPCILRNTLCEKYTEKIP